MDPRRRCGAGGILGLARLLREHGEAIEADLARFYGVDLRDLWRGRLTWRRLLALIRGLPADSALARAQAGPDAAWGLTEHLLARLVDEIAWLTWLTANRDLKPGKRSRMPEPVPRPGVARKQRQEMTDVMANRLLAMAPEGGDDG